MANRILFGALFLIIAIGMLLISIPTGILFMTICGIISAREMGKALRSAGKSPVIWPCYVSVILVAAGILGGLRSNIFICFMSFLPLLVLSQPLLSEKVKPSDALLGMGVCIYPLMPIIFIMFMLAADSSFVPYIFATAVIASVFGDSFAFFIGSAIGRHKLAPRISPHKTIEGLIGGLVFGTVSGMISYAVMKALDIPVFNLPLTLAAAFLATLAGVLGDLAASSVKREAGIKDYSHLIPGHGGMMDRLDSVIFAIPAVYILAMAFGVL